MENKRGFRILKKNFLSVRKKRVSKLRNGVFQNSEKKECR